MSNDDFETTEAPVIPADQPAGGEQQDPEPEERRRKRLLWFLSGLLLLLLLVSGLFIRYLLNPAPLPELLPGQFAVNYPPHYLFSIYGADQPVGVTVSPQGDRIYVAETGGQREIKIFNRNGDLLRGITPPATTAGERAPVYMATDGRGRIYVTDRLQGSIFVYDREGNYLDTILGPDLTLSEFIAKHIGGLPEGSSFYYNIYRPANVYYTVPGEEEQALPAPNPTVWSPLGVRFDPQGNLWLTDLVANDHRVRQISAEIIAAPSWLDFGPPDLFFGAHGQDRGQFLFPNIAVADSQGRLYVTDGNNGRISAWDSEGSFLFAFGRGTGEGALSLPRGAWIDDRDRLHVVDAVGQNVKVYDVSGTEPKFLYEFGNFGIDEGLFNYPNDIILDKSGRLYITDRENNRIQVWSY